MSTSHASGVITKLITGGTLDSALLVKVGYIVMASARVYSISPAVAAAADFFQLPEGYRPARKVYGCGAMSIGSNFPAIMCTISNIGKVNLTYSSGSTTQAWFFAVFSTV